MRVLVTGADGALGTVVCAVFRANGDRVAALAGGLATDAPEHDTFAAGDLSDEGAAQAAVARAAAHLGGLDAVVHLAGGFKWVEVAAAPLSDWRGLFSTNVETAVATAKAALPYLEAGASIVFVGAGSAQPAGAGFGPYGAAKSAVARLTEALAAELRSSKVRVNAVLPAIIDTPQNRLDMPDVDPSVWTSPAAIAGAICFLASPRARAINGALVPVSNPASD